MQIRELIRQTSPFISLEFFPPKERDAWPKFFEVVDRLKALNPLFVSVTYGAGGAAQGNTLEIVSRLKRDHGLEPMAHLTCVGSSRENIAAFLNGLRAEGIENVLALRGDAPRGVDDFDFSTQEFTSSCDLVDFIHANYPEMGIAVSGYPEPHPEASSITASLDWAKCKIDKGGDFMVTQLFFDNRLYVDFVERLKPMGIDVPVVPGILPIMSLKSAKFILSLCGAAIPGKLLHALEKAHEEGGDEAVYRVGMDHAIQQARELLELGAPGIHLYTLNRAEACLEIGRALHI